jgi:hypothetical protein
MRSLNRPGGKQFNSTDPRGAVFADQSGFNAVVSRLALAIAERVVERASGEKRAIGKTFL